MFFFYEAIAAIVLSISYNDVRAAMLETGGVGKYDLIATFLCVRTYVLSPAYV